MSFNITGGIVSKAMKVVIYGPEGIGKTSLAAKLPNPVFIDTEGSTNKYDVKRLPKPTSWQMIIDEVNYIIQQRPCSTLVIDTTDWAERLCIDAVCARHGKTGIEDFGYGNGYVYVGEEWGRFLNLLQEVVDTANINVVLNAHSVIKKFEQPNEMGAYDRYELKMGQKTTARTAGLTKEWADMILFLNYKTFAIQTDKDGKKFKGQGGQRVMYTTHHPCWDAKNRDNLPDELPLDYSAIAHLFENTNQSNIDPTHIEAGQKQVVTETIETPKVENTIENGPVPTNIPKALQDLMRTNGVLEEEIRKVVARKGYYPVDMPISNYDAGFIEGVLVGAWSQVYSEIQIDRVNNGEQF